MDTAGADKTDIQFHYDLSRDFYRLWLDDSMTYSAAMFEDGEDLHAAQMRKLDYHLDEAEIGPGSRVLDVGCGWGSLLERASQVRGAGAMVGLTLSADQHLAVHQKDLPGCDVRLAKWSEYAPDAPFDAIICIGALEHFAQPGLSMDQKAAAYRHFFKFCRAHLAPGGRLSLQTIVFDRMQEPEFRNFITERIFPGSMLPRIPEVLAGADRVMELVKCRNDAMDYARTCRAWQSALTARSKEADALIGSQRAGEYLQFLISPHRWVHLDC